VNIRTLTLEGRGRNALGTATMETLLGALRDAAGAPLLITGAPGAFSAGLDLKEVGALDGDAMSKFLRLLERTMTALYLYPGPTAAAVNGHAIAGGCVLTLCCDVRIAADDPSIKIGLNETALGLRFPPRTLALCRARLSKRDETEVLLGAALFSPQDALRVGIVDAVAKDPLSVARARLETLAAHPSAIYAQTKRDLRGTEQSLCSDEALDRWVADSTPTWTSPDLRARIAKLLERR
jgi:enoyl-CoA hydratase/carnithine racemase